MKKTIIAVAIALASMTANAANNPEDWRVSYASVMEHYNAGRLSQAYAELPRLGLSGAQLDAAWNAIKDGKTWNSWGDFNGWVNSNGNNGNGGNGNSNGQPTSYDKQQDAKIDGKVDKAAFEVDQKRQDDALANEAAQREDGDNRLNASIDQTKQAIANESNVRNQKDQQLQEQINTKVSQGDFDASQQAQNDHINSVQDAAQTANDRATALEGRADGTEAAIRETNQQLEVTDGRSIDNAKRLDGVEQTNTRQDGQIADNATAIQKETDVRSQQFTQLSTSVEKAQATGEYAHSRIDAANANIEANQQALANTNKRVAANTAQLANHEDRLTSLEQQTNKGFSDLKRQIDDNKKDANAGIAGVAAIASIPQVTDKQDFSVGAGVGARGSEQALAVGFSGRITDNVVTKVAVSTDTQSGWTVGAGVAVGW